MFVRNTFLTGFLHKLAKVGKHFSTHIGTDGFRVVLNAEVGISNVLCCHQTTVLGIRQRDDIVCYFGDVDGMVPHTVKSRLNSSKKTGLSLKTYLANLPVNGLVQKPNFATIDQTQTLKP
ncbi:hypothetical protein OGAPHI_004458 [Ogataea philodendri]|uniref:Uncharacterized protein n=1 Tax=Ogataea philodendri TaxID=1378263 RepID=A0A9P8P7U4_9ASCO|nr:uncharacterized protein OGAPHI_004458 [Ogataea philodendri]KAH3666269.1 hypothetical protein OGAPHI_004458 [Ogataea philodendri]